MNFEYLIIIMKYFLLYFIFQSEFRVSTVLFYNVILELVLHVLCKSCIRNIANHYHQYALLQSIGIKCDINGKQH